MSNLGDLYLHGIIGSGSITSYTPPSDWINIDDCADGNINLLVADTTLATYAFICSTSSGQYNVDWGDGINENFDSGATAQHTYTVGAGQICSRGYTTFKIIISPISGDLTSFKVASHSLATQDQEHHILSCMIGSTTLTSLVNAFYQITTAPIVACKALENFKSVVLPVMTDATSMFNGCYSLQSIDVSGMIAVTNATSMFSTCSTLQSIDISGMTALTNATNMFNTCRALQSIDVSVTVTNATSMFIACFTLQSIDISGMTALTNTTTMFSSCFTLQSIDVSGMIAVTNATSMFNGCRALQSIDVSGMIAVTNATSMFYGCYSLQSVIASNFAGNASSVLGTTMFAGCEQLTSINFPLAKFTKFGASGISGRLNKLGTFIFNSTSTFSDSTAPQLDISYTTLTDAQLDTIFTSLPTVTSKTANITGSTGAGTCTRTIATGKGWTITG